MNQIDTNNFLSCFLSIFLNFPALVSTKKHIFATFVDLHNEEMTAVVLYQVTVSPSENPSRCIVGKHIFLLMLRLGKSSIMSTSIGKEIAVVMITKQTELSLAPKFGALGVCVCAYPEMRFLAISLPLDLFWSLLILFCPLLIPF